jgi:HK97 family phage major capsid protein
VWRKVWKVTSLKTRVDAVSGGDKAGVSFIQPSAGPAGTFAQSLLGYPVFLTSAIATNRTVGTGTNRTNIYFGIPSSLIFGDLYGFAIDLNPYSKFSSYQVDIRGIKRTAVLVGIPTNWTKYTAIDPTLSKGS